MESHSIQNNNSLDNAVIYWVPLQKAAISECKLFANIFRPFNTQCLPKSFMILPLCSVKCRGCSTKIKISLLKIFTLLKQCRSLLHEQSSSIPCSQLSRSAL